MAWMSLSPLTPVAMTTPRFLRCCSGSHWTTGSMTPSAAWWVTLLGGTGALERAGVITVQSCSLHVLLSFVGMVQPRPSVCPGWILCKERSPRLSQTSLLPTWSSGTGRKWGNYWPHSSALQLCFLCIPCPWEQVCALFYWPATKMYQVCH